MHHGCGIIVYIDYQSVCPFVGTGSPNPLPRKRVYLPPWTQRGEEQHTLADEGVEGPNLDDWKENLAICVYSVTMGNKNPCLPTGLVERYSQTK